MDTIILDANVRQDIGKGASRRLRRAERVPAIVYGTHITPVSIELEHRHVIKFIRNKELSSQIITINAGNESYKAVVKNLERHSYKNKVSHIEFQAVSASDMMTVEVAIHFLNEDRCVGVKQGGKLSIQLKTVKVRCAADNMPGSIDVDLEGLDLDQTLHLSDIKWPNGVESSDLSHGKDHNLAVASVQSIK